MSDAISLYEAVGGLPFFEELVDRFYDRAASDPDLLSVYPQPEDLGPARRRLALFLGEYWGGPPAYSAERGHPMLRRRHFPFAIGTAERVLLTGLTGLAGSEHSAPAATVPRSLRPGSSPGGSTSGLTRTVTARPDSPSTMAAC